METLMRGQMKRSLTLLAPIVLFANLTQAGEKAEEATNATDLRCEYLASPLGVDEDKPRLSWIVESDQRGLTQTAYQVLVANSLGNLENNQGDLWDSGRVESDQSLNVVYRGKALQSRQHCFWKVRTWYGFKSFIVAPYTKTLDWVKCEHMSPYGKIVSNWSKQNGKLTMRITVPANTTATVHIPGKNITEGGEPAAKAKGVTFLRTDDGKSLYRVNSGTYEFASIETREE